MSSTNDLPGNDELCQFIEAAFAEAPKPLGRVSLPTYDDEGTNEYFARSEWRAHNAKDLRMHNSALSFFTPAAFRYYLPAFLLASIRRPGEVDVIPEGIVFHLQRDLAGKRERLQELSPREREALARFVDWHADYPPFPWQVRERRGHIELTALAQALRAAALTA